MKKISLIFALSLMSAVICKAQLTHTGEFVKVVLPTGTYKLNKQQINSLANSKLADKSLKVYPHHLYKSNDILFGLNNVNQDSINNNLPNVKLFIDQLYNSAENHNRTYISTIKNTYNNNHALIVNYIIKDVGYYRFYCQNASKRLTLSGKIEYKNVDSVKAKALLDAILNNIEFTK